MDIKKTRNFKAEGIKEKRGKTKDKMHLHAYVQEERKEMRKIDESEKESLLFRNCYDNISAGEKN